MTPPLPDSTSTPPASPKNDSHAGIVLLGLRGSGKSTVGRLLAERLGRVFVDLDDLVLTSFAEHQSVAAVWVTVGEAGWRERECALALQHLEKCAASESILALGGGGGMIPAVRDYLQTKAVRIRDEGAGIQVVYLRGEPGLLADRLGRSPGDRPALTDSTDLLDEIRMVYAERDPVYRDLADAVIELVRDESPSRLLDRFMPVLLGYS